MIHVDELQARAKQLTERTWDVLAIQARHQKLLESGITRKAIDWCEIITQKEHILDRIQLRAEEYEYFGRNWAKGAALPVMEEFGMGNLEILKALSPFPGFGITGWICGAVSGGLVSLGLFFGSDDLTNYSATGKAIAAARVFIPRFEKVLTSILCPKIQEDVIFGRYMDQRASADNMQAFIRENGFVKCALPAGIGARIAAEIIIESMEDKQAA